LGKSRGRKRRERHDDQHQRGEKRQDEGVVGVVGRERGMIRRCDESDRNAIFEIINDGARAYKGCIPDDRWHEPYMPMEELEEEMAQGVRFWGEERGGELLGVMGLQDRGDAILIRHAYVRTRAQRMGVGTRLLQHLEGSSARPMLVGTWAAASWAISFYERNGYTRVPEEEKNRLLRTYWTIPERQVETSVVLANEVWREARRVDPTGG
jgi:GNAT superfamily N-acetyltransferase